MSWPHLRLCSFFRVSHRRTTLWYIQYVRQCSSSTLGVHDTYEIVKGSVLMQHPSYLVRVCSSLYRCYCILSDVSGV
jgi:hypothetical protein